MGKRRIFLETPPIVKDIDRFILRLLELQLLIIRGDKKGIEKLLRKAKKKREDFISISKHRN